MNNRSGKSLTAFVIASMVAIVAYTALQIWFQKEFEIVTARIKNTNTKSMYNKMTECDDVPSDSDEVVG